MNYKVYQDTTLKTTVSSKTATINGLTPNTNYIFGVIPNNGLRDGEQKTITVKTRGIRFNIPKTLTVGSTIMLRYEEYPLGIVPIGKEPSGMFGGGNKQNLSAKVISTANGSSVVEVAGDVIDVGGHNLLTGTSNAQDYTVSGSGWSLGSQSSNGTNISIPCTPGASYTYSEIVKSTTYDCYPEIQFFDIGKNLILNSTNFPGKDTGMRKSTAVAPENATFVGVHMVLNAPSDSQTMVFNSEKLEKGDIATPYASFVDGDTFTAQPDGTCALFSEYKALYY